MSRASALLPTGDESALTWVTLQSVQFVSFYLFII